MASVFISYDIEHQLELLSYSKTTHFVPQLKDLDATRLPLPHRFQHSLAKPWHRCSGDHFTNDFSITIEIWWKICYSVTPLQGIILLPDFAHDMTPQQPGQQNEIEEPGKCREQFNIWWSSLQAEIWHWEIWNQSDQQFGFSRSCVTLILYVLNFSEGT